MKGFTIWVFMAFAASCSFSIRPCPLILLGYFQFQGQLHIGLSLIHHNGVHHFYGFCHNMHGKKGRDLFPLKGLNFDPFQLKLHSNYLFCNLEDLFCFKVEFCLLGFLCLLGLPCFLGFLHPFGLLRLLFRSFIHNQLLWNASMFRVLFFLFTQI